MKVTIINDTSGRHFGCELVMQTFREQLDRVGIEILTTIPVKTQDIKIPKNTDLVIVNGEGSLHRGQHQQLIKIADLHPSILVNSVWQDNPSYPQLHKFKYISVRESFSYNELPKKLNNTEIVPDISFASSFLKDYKKEEPTKEFGYTDNVVQKKNLTGLTALQSASQFIPQLCSHKRMCLGRFHAVVAAAVLQIPFSVWPSNSHKMLGMLTDMETPHLHFKTQEEALENIPIEFDKRISKYVNNAQIKIEKMFEDIWRLA